MSKEQLEDEVQHMRREGKEGRKGLHPTHRNMKEPSGTKMVLQSDAIEEPFLVPQRTFRTRVL